MKNTATPQLITVTKDEKREWSRFAQACYATDRNDLGHRFSVAATLLKGGKLPIHQFDELQSIYRKWLISGFSK